MNNILDDNVMFYEKNKLIKSFGKLLPFIQYAYFMTTKWDTGEPLSTRIVIQLNDIPESDSYYPPCWSDLLTNINYLKTVYKKGETWRDGCVLRYSLPPIAIKF